MLNRTRSLALVTIIATGTLPNSTFAGGLADAIVERQPVTIQDAPDSGIPGWVIPVAALVILGAVVASSGGGDSDEPDDPENSIVEDDFTFPDDLK